MSGAFFLQSNEGVTMPAIPKRSEELSRERDANRSGRPDLKKGVSREAKAMPPDRSWHPVAKMIYSSLRKSGQADFYEQSDWAYAWFICDQVSANVSSKEGDAPAKKISAMTLTAIDGALSKLLMTEADRRRVRIELDDPTDDEDDASVTAIEEYKAQLGVVQ